MQSDTGDEYRNILAQVVGSHGGAQNFHAHIDRAGTLHPRYLQAYGLTPLNATLAALQVKQSIVGELHRGPAYDTEDLARRMRIVLDRSIAAGIRRLVSCIDATPDIGMRALDVALALKAEYGTNGLTLEVVPHPIFGFKEDLRYSTSRWDLFRDACARCDGVGSLPERDVRADSIGHTEHLRRTLLLGKELQKPVYVHVGQAHDPRERDIFELIEAVKWLDLSVGPYDDPCVWAVHALSPSTYSEADFRDVLVGLKAQRIGVICCPRAALSMRQNRALVAPLHNSVARVLEMALVGIPIRLGTDNIADLFVPTSTEDMLDQVIVLADALRFYDPAVLGKFVAGVRLNDNDKQTIRQHLENDITDFRATDPSFRSCTAM